MNKYDTTYAEKEAFKRNLSQALEWFSFRLDEKSEEMEFVMDVIETMGGPIQDFEWQDYTSLAEAIVNEDDVESALIAQGYLPVLASESVEMREWLADHEDAIQDILTVYDHHYIDECPDEDIIDWLCEHDQARMDCYRYIINNHYCSD